MNGALGGSNEYFLRIVFLWWRAMEYAARSPTPSLKAASNITFVPRNLPFGSNCMALDTRLTADYAHNQTLSVPQTPPFALESGKSLNDVLERYQ